MLNRETKFKPLQDADMQGAEMQEYCDICGGQGKFYGNGKNYHILLCEQCGLIWTNPLEYELAKKSIASNYWGEEIYLANVDAQKKRFRKQLEIFKRKTNVLAYKSIKILEVGSGLGFFLDICDELGIVAEGCDIAEKAVKFANRERERVRLGTLDAYYKNESYHAIFAFNLIEHLAHPKDFFTESRRILKSGGILVLEMPIQESLFHKLARAGFLIFKGRLNFFGINPGAHIYKFSKKTFKFICNDIGFKCVYQKNINSPFGEIWGKSSIVSFDYRLIYRLSLPIVWTIAKLTGQGNRLFILLQKP